MIAYTSDMEKTVKEDGSIALHVLWRFPRELWNEICAENGIFVTCTGYESTFQDLTEEEAEGSLVWRSFYGKRAL